MLRLVVWSKFTDVSEVLAVPIIRAMSTVMMEAASISETSLNVCQTARLNVPEDIFILTAVKAEISHSATMPYL
jgi:hypothetical protein